MKTLAWIVSVSVAAGIGVVVGVSSTSASYRPHPEASYYESIVEAHDDIGSLDGLFRDMQIHGVLPRSLVEDIDRLTLNGRADVARDALECMQRTYAVSDVGSVGSVLINYQMYGTSTAPLHTHSHHSAKYSDAIFYAAIHSIGASRAWDERLLVMSGVGLQDGRGSMGQRELAAKRRAIVDLMAFLHRPIDLVALDEALRTGDRDRLSEMFPHYVSGQTGAEQ